MDFMAGMQNMRAGYEMGQFIRQEIDAKKHARELDRLLSKIGTSVPTPNQYLQLQKYMGPEVARDFMDVHEMAQEMKGRERDEYWENFNRGNELTGTFVETLSAVPEEQRMEVLTELASPFLQDQYGKTLLGISLVGFQDGDFSDEKLQRLATSSYAFGRSAEIEGNRRRAAEEAEVREDTQAHEIEVLETEQAFEAEQAGADRAVEIEEIRRSNPTPQERQSAAQDMAQQYGGTMSDWFVFLGRDPERMLEESFDDEGNIVFVNKATNKPLNLGTFTMGDPNDPLGTPEVGSPESFTIRTR